MSCGAEGAEWRKTEPQEIKNRDKNRGKWGYSPDHGQLCHVIEVQTQWDETTCCARLPGRGSVVRIAASRLKSLLGPRQHRSRRLRVPR